MHNEPLRTPSVLKLTLSIACVASALLVLPGKASAQAPGATLGGLPLFGVFYESGLAYINGVAQQSFPDPTTGAPTWLLPVSVVPGDVLGTEPGTGGTVVSDLLRFPEVVAGVSDRVMLFSDLDADSPGDKADVGIPATFQLNTVTVPEINGEIDYDVPGGIVDYHVFSEVPEPSVFSLGFLGLAAGMLRLRRTAQA